MGAEVLAALGTAAITLGFVAAVVGVGSLTLGLIQGNAKYVKAGRVYALLTFVGAAAAFVIMEVALLTDDFSVVYVAETSARATPLLYKIATLWAALEGSIILWVLVLTGFLVATLVASGKRLDDPLVGVAVIVQLVVVAFFFGLMVGPADPFVLVDGPTPADGPGPNPLLQNHPLQAVHPPLLYLGYVGFTVPFSFAVAALVTGRLGEGWLVATRRWTLFAWGGLTLGIISGAWWSYEVLGWGGYWAWDPVENASFLPWLTGTAFLHSVVVQERTGMLRVWNLSLLLATFALTIFGTFLTRSGVIDSVHAFAEGGVGPALLVFFGVITAVSLGLLAWRGDQLRSPGAIDSPVSREGSFLVNNLLFAALTLVVLLGTVFPLIIEALRDDRIAVGRPYFDRMSMPVGLALLFLMAAAPLLTWRRTSGELLRDRLLVPAWVGAASLVFAVAVGGRGFFPLLGFTLAGFAGGSALSHIVAAVRRSGWRGFVGRANGGMIVHLGVVLVAVGFIASSSYTREGELRLLPGESGEVAGHDVTYIGFETVEEPAKRVIQAEVLVDGRVFEPGVEQFRSTGQSIGVPSVRVGLTEDVYLVLVRTPQDAEEAIALRVIIEPLVTWIWIGGAVMGLGTLLALVPTARRRRVPVEVPDEAPEPEREAVGVGG
ncbi:MAG: heme lyase CcmF/NrfE family subunit [Actinomycetota bacterium]